MRRSLYLAFALLLIAGLATGCGGGGGAGGAVTVPGPDVEIEADPSGGFAYVPDRIVAAPGRGTLVFINPQSVQHVVKVEDAKGETVAETALIRDSSASTSIELKKGMYAFYCSVPGHREKGMEGTLIVR